MLTRAGPPAPGPPARAVWRRIPPGLAVAGLVSGCLLLIAGAGYVTGLVAVRLAPLLIAVAAALLITALLGPLVDSLQRLRVPRALGAALSLLALVGVFAAPAALLLSLAATQFADVASRLGEGVLRVRKVATEFLPVSDAQLTRMVDGLRVRADTFGVDAVAGALTLLEVLAAVVFALFVAFFLLKDGRSIWAWLLDQLPSGAQPVAAEAGQVSWRTLTHYVRGIIIVAAIDAVGIGIALAVIGVPLALPLALLVFVGGLVPYVGSTVSGAVAVLVALAANGSGDALLTLAAVVAVQQIEGNFLEPLIVGRQVRLHPVVVVAAVFAGSLTAGIAGAVVAVPMTAVIYRVVRVIRAPRLATPEAQAAPGHA